MPPDEPESRFGRWIRSCLYRIAFVGVLGLIGHQCSQHHDPSAVGNPPVKQAAVSTLPPELQQLAVDGGKLWREKNPKGSFANPYSPFLGDDVDYDKLPDYSYWVDARGDEYRKLPEPFGNPQKPKNHE